MWPFAKTTHHRQQHLLSARPHPSRILRSHSRRTKSLVEHDKMVIIVRTDLDLSPGRIANQAASIAVRLFQRVCRYAGVCTRWNRTGQQKVLLRVNDPKTLDDITKRAVDSKIAVSAAHMKIGHLDKVRTVIGLFGPTTTIDSLTRHLKLY